MKANMGSTVTEMINETITTVTTTWDILVATGNTSGLPIGQVAMVQLRPNTLAVATKQRKNMDTKKFIREALHAWRAKARCNIVPAERLHELFEELKFSPTEKQINEMLQTAKLFARRGGEANNCYKHMNGLTFGEFCVLAADLKRFRTQNTLQRNQSSDDDSLSSGSSDPLSVHQSRIDDLAWEAAQQQQQSKNDFTAPEVFLGGSCNPTTWRADVAIPTLDKLGISFYNPQVSDWTPDLIELEHRAKEKARVLFFVMDSETRGSAGAIEAAHIAGQNSRNLVLVLHAYKPDQRISNEPITPQEFIDLKRNQQLLKELVTRRGQPVLDSIPSGLQRTRAILAGNYGRVAPQNIASRLIAVRRAFDRVLDRSNDELSAADGTITLTQCQCALNFLGYAQNLLSLDNLSDIVLSHREVGATSVASNKSQNKSKNCSDINIDFDEFCMLTSYLTFLQHEIHESGCISPIKGTNLQPPPIFLTNTPEWMNSHQNGEHIQHSETTMLTMSMTPSKHNRSSSSTYSRDSGTSSPQPNESRSSMCISTPRKMRSSYTKMSTASLSVDYYSNSSDDQLSGFADEIDEELSDSNDSVFSSGSSIDSTLNYMIQQNCDDYDLRDLYLGGSCMLRTNWRQQHAIPLMISKGITFHLPQLHESLEPANGQVGTFGELNGTSPRKNMFNPTVLEASRVLVFVITNETRSLAPMTLAAHCIGLGYNVVLCVQMLPDDCEIREDKLTPAAIKDYNRGRAYLIDLAKRQDVPVSNDLAQTLEYAIEKLKKCKSRNEE